MVYHDRPHNVDSCYTLQAEQLLSRAGAQLFFGITGGGGRARFFDDIGQQIRDAEHGLETNKDQFGVLEKDKRKVLEPVNKLGKDLEDAKASIQLLFFLNFFYKWACDNTSFLLLMNNFREGRVGCNRR